MGNSDNIKGKIKFGIALCTKHLLQMKKYGKITDSTDRTIFDNNEIICYGDHAEIILYSRDTKKLSKTKIDLPDIEKVRNLKWCLCSTTGYVINSKFTLHQYLMGCGDNLKIDHINRDKLDNRRCNLRFVSDSENGRNITKRKGCSSNQRGVYFDRVRDTWIAQICTDNVNVNLGRFSTEKEAIKKRLQAEKKYWGKVYSVNPEYLIANDE